MNVDHVDVWRLLTLMSDIVPPASETDHVTEHPQPVGQAKMSSKPTNANDTSEDSYVSYSSDYSTSPDEVSRSITPADSRNGYQQRAKVPNGHSLNNSLNRGSGFTNKKIPVNPMVKKRLLSATRLKMNDMQNQMGILQKRIKDLEEENRLLQRVDKRNQKELARYVNAESELPNMLLKHHTEENSLKIQLRRTQEKNRKCDEKLRAQDKEMEKLKDKLKKAQELNAKKKLPERLELEQRLEKLEFEKQQKEAKIRELEKNIELLQKSNTRDVAREVSKHKETQRHVMDLEALLDRTKREVWEKQKESEVKSAYQSRIMRPPHRLSPGSTPSPKSRSQSSDASLKSGKRKMKGSSKMIETTSQPLLPNSGTKSFPKNIEKGSTIKTAATYSTFHKPQLPMNMSPLPNPMTPVLEECMDSLVNNKDDLTHENVHHTLKLETDSSEGKEDSQRHKKMEREEKGKRKSEQEQLEIQTATAKTERDERKQDSVELKNGEEESKLELDEEVEADTHKPVNQKLETPKWQEKERVKLIKNEEEEKHKKELLLARMQDIDQKQQMPYHTRLPPTSLPSLTHESSSSQHVNNNGSIVNAPPSINEQTFVLPKQNFHNGFPGRDKNEPSILKLGPSQNKPKDQMQFGAYMPSFETGKTLTKEDRKANLMTSLFGNNNVTRADTSELGDTWTIGDSKTSFGENNIFLPSIVGRPDNVLKSNISKPNGKVSVSEDDIEELQL